MVDPTRAGAASPPINPRTALAAPNRNDSPPASAVISAIPTNAVCRPGPTNPWTTTTGSGQALTLVHNNWVNIKTDADGGLDDFSSKHTGGVNLLFGDGEVVTLLRSCTLLKGLSLRRSCTLLKGGCNG